jgi:Tfp pilus assembly pilus retraction ATPase PilT
VVEVARATEQKIDSILDAAEQQDASDVFLQENEVPRLKINEPDRIGFGYGIEDG